MSSQKGQTISLPDGRRLGYCVIGSGKPVVYFHGTASSRLEVLLLRELADSGLQLVGIDRPGYGLSAYHPRVRLEDFNSDVNALIGRLGFERVGVLGWSGGGAFALSYLACFPKRVSRAVVVGAPWLPFDVSTAHNMPFARFALKIPYAGYFAMRRIGSQVLRADGAEAFLKTAQGRQMLRACSQSDLRFFQDPVWMELMYQSMAEGFRQGGSAVKTLLGEHQAFVKPWTVSFGSVPAGKLAVWHGREDKTCPVQNGRLIARQVVGSQLMVFEGKGHFVLFEYQKRLAAILVGG